MRSISLRASSFVTKVLRFLPTEVSHAIALHSLDLISFLGIKLVKENLKKEPIKILGQDYVVRSSAGQKYLNEVSAYVNEKMEEIKASGIDDSQQLRIAVLAAMNITDELLAYKKDKQKFVDKVEAKTRAITEFIDNRIEEIESEKK